MSVYLTTNRTSSIKMFLNTSSRLSQLGFRCGEGAGGAVDGGTAV